MLGTLGHYLLRRNLWFMGLCLGLGAGIYLLFDLFDRLDDFVAAKTGLLVIVTYYGAKLPLILAQILPAVFILAMLIQLSFMGSSRELMALRAGGIGPSALLRFFLLYSLIWTAGQLFLTEIAGQPGHAYAQRIWNEKVQGRSPGKQEVLNLWFRQGMVIGHIDTVLPKAGQGKGIALYEMTDNRQRLTRVIQAQTFKADSSELQLTQARVFDLIGMRSQEMDSMNYPLGLDLRAFSAQAADQPASQQSILELAGRIRQLKSLGSNVEGLQTAVFARISYAAAMIALALAAMAIATFDANIFINVVAGLAATFAFYTLHSLGSAAGEQGVLPPMLGAFLGNVVVAAAAIARLVWPHRS